MTTIPMTEKAEQALKAVEIFKRCGRYPAYCYAKKTCGLFLYRLAKQLTAAEKIV